MTPQRIAAQRLLHGGVLLQDELLQVGLLVLRDLARDAHEMALVQQDVLGRVDLLHRVHHVVGVDALLRVEQVRRLRVRVHVLVVVGDGGRRLLLVVALIRGIGLLEGCVCVGLLGFVSGCLFSRRPFLGGSFCSRPFLSSRPFFNGDELGWISNTLTSFNRSSTSFNRNSTSFNRNSTSFNSSITLPIGRTIKQLLKLIEPRRILRLLRILLLPIPLIAIGGGLLLIHPLTHNYIRRIPSFFALCWGHITVVPSTAEALWRRIAV